MSQSLSTNEPLRSGDVMLPGTSDTIGVKDQTFNYELQRRLLEAISGDKTRNEAITAVLQVLDNVCDPTSILYCRQESNTGLVPAWELTPPESGRLQPQFQNELAKCCKQASESSSLHIAFLGPNGCLLAIAVPVLLNRGIPESIGIVLPTANSDRQRLAGTLQVVASHVTLWEVLQISKHAETESSQSAALLELLAKCDGAESSQEACSILTNELQSFLKCQQVAIGLRGLRRSTCRLYAVSGVSRFDHRSADTAAMEAALDESILRDRPTIWPPVDDAERGGALAHARACRSVSAESVVSSPLYDDKGTVVGAWLVFGDSENIRHQETQDFLIAAAQQVGSTLALLQRAAENPFTKQIRLLANSWRARYCALCVVLLIALMFLPIRYKVGCDCRVQPVTRRFVSAPYDGKLETSFVKPGDEVTEGSLLARLDGRELRWEMAGLEAEYNRAWKSRDSALATDSISDSQQAALETERLKLKMELCRNRLDNLEIRSPVAGMIISGDLKKTEGAPLAVGQTLFEIAPLSRMIVEVEIPEREILYAKLGQTVIVRVDAYPFRKWPGEISRIFPKAEISENSSVYIAEVYLENDSGEFRPGMKGRAKIVTQHRALGWILFHRPFESLCMFLGW